jgi:4-amino-4-deoxy-L-arabinose transferase
LESVLRCSGRNALFWLYRTALLLLRDENKAITAVFVLASSFLFLVVSRTVETDIYLTCFVIGAQYYLFRQIYGPKSRWNACGYAFFLGLGFLTKGPVVFVLTLVPNLAAKLFDKRHRRSSARDKPFSDSAYFWPSSFHGFVAVIHVHRTLSLFHQT